MELDELLAKVDIYPFFESQGLSFEKKTSKGWYAECPFCLSKQKIRVNEKGLWKCFKCEETGNIITFYAKLNSCSNGEAVKAIKEFAGIEDDWKPKHAVQPKVNQTDVPVNSPPGEKPDGGGLSKETAMGAARPRDIYTTLVKVAALTDVHHEELRSKRGFTNDIIERLSFRSGGPYMAQLIEKMREQFTDRDLKEAGILVEVNGTLAYNQQLLDGRILVPYLDDRGEVYYLRPHKLGFEGLAPEVYCRLLLEGIPEKPETVVLTEGEFKAGALYQWGIAAIAVPGISSFGGKYLDRLVELLKEYGVKKVVVVFDNEIKDNPELPNYKEKPEKRYDAEFWSYMMAYRLGRAGFAARIGKLPDEWRVNGKVDFDGALAAGHTREEILKVIDQAKVPNEYREALPDEARKIVNRKLAKQFTVVPVKREFNKYIVVRAKGDSTWEETISNFVINIKSSFFTPDGVIRNVNLVNEYGEVSDTFPLAPSDMAGLNEWKKFCFSKGNYIFKGSTQDLLYIWELEFLRDMGDLIYMPERIGYIGDGVWLFGNMAIKNGEIFRPDNDGIIWIAGKGYKPQSLQIGTRGEAIEDAIPSLTEKPLDMADVARRFYQTIGGYEAYVGIGWVIATVFSADIFAAYKCMPILFPHGKRESGKSTFMRWLMGFFGIETEGVGIAETTQNFIARSLAYYSGLGCWFDEYRNEAKVIQKDGFFRSAYNRQLSGKGTATAFQAKGFSVHAAVAVSGEELPKDNGLFTRCIPLQISAYKRDRTHYEWLNRHLSEFSYLTYYLITHYDELLPKVLANIAELKKVLLARDISDRTAENWAICAACFETVILQDDAFIQWVEETCQEIRTTAESEHMLNQFWSDVSYLATDGKLDHHHLKVETQGRLLIWLSGVYQEWALHYRSKTGREPFDEVSIRKYLTDEPYYLGNGREYFGPANKQVRRRAITLDIENAPEIVQEVADSVTGSALF